MKGHDFDSAGTYILRKIEEAGMLPPNIDGDKYYGCYECGGDTVFTWEFEE